MDVHESKAVDDANACHEEALKITRGGQSYTAQAYDHDANAYLGIRLQFHQLYFQQHLDIQKETPLAIHFKLSHCFLLLF